MAGQRGRTAKPRTGTNEKAGRRGAAAAKRESDRLPAVRQPMTVLPVKVPEALISRLDAFVAQAVSRGEHATRGTVVRAALIAHLSASGF